MGVLVLTDNNWLCVIIVLQINLEKIYQVVIPLATTRRFFLWNAVNFGASEEGKQQPNMLAGVFSSCSLMVLQDSSRVLMFSAATAELLLVLLSLRRF